MSYIDWRRRRRRRSPRTMSVFHYRDKTINFIFAQRELDEKRKTNERRNAHSLFGCFVYFIFDSCKHPYGVQQTINFIFWYVRLPFRQPAPAFHAGPIRVFMKKNNIY